MRVLSVDDSEPIRRFIKTAVDVLGFEFLEAADGKAALELLEEERGEIDLILLDWHMPMMDGMQVLEALKADHRFEDIPVTMVTQETEMDRVTEAINKGAKNYLIKPFSQEDLTGKIMESLGLEL